MLIKQIVKMSRISLSLAICYSLYGCTLTNVTDHTELCNKLQRQAIYNKNNLNNEAGWTTPTQKDHLKDLIKQYNCTP
jgi:hypothetical protein